MAKSRNERFSGPSLPIEVTIDGRVIKGSYVVDRGLIRVTSELGGHKTTQVGNVPAPGLAKLLLSEVIGEQRRKGAV